MSVKDEKITGENKVWLGYLIGLVALGALIWACVEIGADPYAKWLNGLLLIFGGLLGWVTGILVSPINPKEQAQFLNYATAISTFFTGFLLAKLDKLFDTAVNQGTITIAAAGPALIFASAFLLGALFTFVGRRYLKL